jgi:hypothetical protein
MCRTLIDGKALADEFSRLEESAMYSAQNQFEQAKQWRGINLMLGLPASVLATVSAATALASTTGRFWAGLLALAAAAFGAVLTTVNASHRINQASSVANAYLEIQTAARQARLLDLSSPRSRPCPCPHRILRPRELAGHRLRRLPQFESQANVRMRAGISPDEHGIARSTTFHLPAEYRKSPVDALTTG